MCDSETSSVCFFSLSILIISSPLWISPDDIFSSALCYGCVVVYPQEMGGLHNNMACAAIICISQGPKTLSGPCKVLKNCIFWVFLSSPYYSHLSQVLNLTLMLFWLSQRQASHIFIPRTTTSSDIVRHGLLNTISTR